MNDSADSTSDFLFVRAVASSAAAIDSLADAANARGADRIFTGSNTVDVAFGRPLAALRYAVSARDHYESTRLAIHRGRFLDADRRGVSSSRGPAHAVLTALADAASPGQILMSERFFGELGFSGRTAFDMSSRDLGRIRLSPGTPPTHVHALTANGQPEIRSIGATNLPGSSGHFFGRERELSSLFSHVQRNQVVTITGPNGIGKTHLAVEFGRRLRDQNRELDIWFVDLTRCDSLEDVVAAISNSLVLPLTSSTSDNDPLVALGRAVASRRDCLVILDGADRIGSGVAVGLQTLLPMAPSARWIVTTNNPLNLVPEFEFPLEGLNNSSAARLLDARRHGGGESFEIRESQVDEATTVADHLDGSPLAVRLVAGLVPVGSPRRILDFLDRLPRSRTEPVWALLLEALGQLDEPHLRALDLLAAPRAPLPVEAALEMGDRAGLDLDTLLPDLTRLALVERRRTKPGIGCSFLSVSEAVRDARRSHEDLPGLEPSRFEVFSSTYRNRGRELLDGVEGNQQAEYLDRIEAERPVLEEAARRSVDISSTSAAAAASALQSWYSTRGPRSHGRKFLKHLCDNMESEPRAQRAEVLVRLAELDELVGAYEDCDRRLRTAIQLLEESEHRPGLLGLALARRHALSRRHEDLDSPENADLLEGASEAGDRGDSLKTRAIVALESAVDARVSDDHSAAVQWVDEAHEAAEQMGQPELMAKVHLQIGRVEKESYRFESSRRDFRAAVALLREVECVPEAAGALAETGQVERHLRETDHAEWYLREALQLARQSGELEDIASIQLQLGRLLAAELEIETARDELLEVLDATDEFFWPRIRGPARAFLAATEAALGRHDTARRSFERAETELENLDASRWNRSFELLEHIFQVAAVDHGLEEPAALRPAQRAVADTTRNTPRHEVVFDVIRLVDRYLQRVEGRANREFSESTRPTRPTLRIDAEGTWLHPPGHDRIDISRRKAPRRMIRRLALHRHQFPGAPLSIELLAEVGWPDETLSYERTKNRVYDAVSTLRDLGLRDILLTRDPGYLLSTRFTVHRITSAPPTHAH